MDILEQCQIWNENDEYAKIIEAIEALPDEERTPETDSELARAYNNLAGLEDRELYEKALELLLPHEDYFQGDHCWNFRTAYAYYYLDQEGPALRYFERALEARPGDKDTEEFIDDCRRRLALPQFEKTFRERTAQAWAAFAKEEEQLRRLMDSEDREAVSDELIGTCSRLLRPALADAAFELGFNGEKYELILTPEGNHARLFAMVYFQSHAPAEILERWNILVGRQPSRGFGLRAFGQEITAGDVQVWLEKQEDRTVSLVLYCEKLLPLLAEDAGKVWWMLSTLTDQVLGEIPAMALIEDFEAADKPQAGPSVLLEALPQALEELGLTLSLDAQAYLDSSYTAYELEPEKDPDAAWRMDVFAGVTRCPALVSEYLADEGGVMDDFHRDGAVPGFFCYPLDGFDGEDRGKKVLDFRDALEAAIQEAAGVDAVTFLGGASGLYCGYLDFIAWDLPAVLKAAAAVFADSPAEWSAFHTFRRDVSTVRLTGGEDDEADDSADEVSEEAPEEAGRSGSFVGFVLLKENHWDREKLLRDLREEWGLEAEGAEGDGDSLLFSVGDMMAAVSRMPAPVPGHEAEDNAANNYMWPEAVEAARTHKAHILVAVLGSETDLLERGRLFVKIMACCAEQADAAGVYTSGTVFEPRLYRGFAEVMKDGALPIDNWIWFGLYRGEAGVCGYTYGMNVFGRDEMEVLDADAQPAEVRSFLASLAAYVLEYDVTLQDGETIGFSADDKHPISRSAGVSLPGTTLKIGYAAQQE